jgi:hypothetical protein
MLFPTIASYKEPETVSVPEIISLVASIITIIAGTITIVFALTSRGRVIGPASQEPSSGGVPRPWQPSMPVPQRQPTAASQRKWVLRSIGYGLPLGIVASLVLFVLPEAIKDATPQTVLSLGAIAILAILTGLLPARRFGTMVPSLIAAGSFVAGLIIGIEMAFLTRVADNFSTTFGASMTTNDAIFAYTLAATFAVFYALVIGSPAFIIAMLAGLAGRAIYRRRMHVSYE